jgi:hypothetical protein
MFPNFHYPMFFDPRLPFLAFCPSLNPFKMDCLRCLDFTLQALPIEYDSRYGFVLSSKSRQDWDSLEQNMRAILNTVLKQGGGMQGKARFWPYPRQYKYLWAFATEAEARIAAERSRLSFVPLIAAISFELCLIRHRSPKSQWKWQEHLSNSTTISAEWLLSFNNIFSIPVAGVYIDMSDPENYWVVRPFKNSEVPVALYWGTTRGWSTGSAEVHFQNDISYPPTLP